MLDDLRVHVIFKDTCNDSCSLTIWETHVLSQTTRETSGLLALITKNIPFR